MWSWRYVSTDLIQLYKDGFGGIYRECSFMKTWSSSNDIARGTISTPARIRLVARLESKEETIPTLNQLPCCRIVQYPCLRRMKWLPMLSSELRMFLIHKSWIASWVALNPFADVEIPNRDASCINTFLGSYLRHNPITPTFATWLGLLHRANAGIN